MGRWVEIGSLRERVEVIEEPVGGRRGRVGRIRHANGENATIDALTLQRLMRRAQVASEAGITLDASEGVRASGVLWA